MMGRRKSKMGRGASEKGKVLKSLVPFPFPFTIYGAAND